MSESLNQFEDLKQRLSNASITALIPSILYFSENGRDERGRFKDNESLLFFKQIKRLPLNCAKWRIKRIWGRAFRSLFCSCAR